MGMILELLLRMLIEGLMRSVTATVTRRSFVYEVDGYLDRRRLPKRRTGRGRESRPPRLPSRAKAAPPRMS